ncbi:MAG TPA: hypothetical protein VM935_17830 [Chitinophagaceae bacterium]|nr:hypothetical protein [Chitinophagaceae bacterium]
MNSIVPEQNKGSQSNTEASQDFASAEEAVHFYSLARKRLLNVNEWHQVAGTLSADFALTDNEGNPITREPKESDHFKIDIPGPGPANGDGYDWVRVEEIAESNEESGESMTIRVRPSTSPVNRQPGVAHFFSEDATSCFVIKRTGNTVTASVFGRNEKPNTDVEKIVDKARNTAVASGAVTAFSKLQWKSLVEGFVKL